MLSRILRLFDLRRKPAHDPSRDLSDGDEARCDGIHVPHYARAHWPAGTKFCRCTDFRPFGKPVPNDEPSLASEVRAALDPDYCGWVDCPDDFECGAPPAPHVPAGVSDSAGGGDPFMPAAGTIPNARSGGGPRFSLHADRNS